MRSVASRLATLDLISLVSLAPPVALLALLYFQILVRSPISYAVVPIGTAIIATALFAGSFSLRFDTRDILRSLMLWGCVIWACIVSVSQLTYITIFGFASEPGTISAFIAVAVAFMSGVLLKPAERRRALLIALMIAACIPGILIARYSSQDFPRATFRDSLALAATVSTEMPHTLFVGSGARSYGYTWNTHRLPHVNESDRWNVTPLFASNAWMTIAAEFGIPFTFALFFGYVLFIAESSAHVMTRRRETIAAVVALSAVVGIGFFTMPVTIAFMIASYAAGYLIPLRSSPPRRERSHWAYRASVAALSCACILVAVPHAAAMYELSRAVADAKNPSSSVDTIEAHFTRSITFADMPYTRRLFAQFYLNLNQNVVTATRAGHNDYFSREEAERWASAGVREAERASSANITDYDSLVMYAKSQVLRAVLLGGDGFVSDAILLRMRTEFPDQPLTYLMEAQNAIMIGRPAAAEDALRKAIRLKPHFDEAAALIEVLRHDFVES